MLLEWNTGSLVLPDDLQWVDEFTWTPVQNDVVYLLNGSVLISSIARTSGRPITLVSQENGAFLTRTMIESLYTISGTADLEMVVTLHDERSFDVKFNTVPFTAKPIVFFSPQINTDYYSVSINLIEYA